MSDDTPKTDEGSSPVDDIKKQNPGATTTGDQTGEANDDASGEASDDPHKVEKLTKAGRDDVDPDDGSE
jgi:hypothetical protein